MCAHASQNEHKVTTCKKKMAEVLLGGKRLTELKVTELKAELDKRGLPKKGVKSVLVQRLKNVILKEALTQVSIRVMCTFVVVLCESLFLSSPKILKLEMMTKPTKVFMILVRLVSNRNYII